MLEHLEKGPLLDVGIGCGQFVEAMNSAMVQCHGQDVNPDGIAWLQRNCWERKDWAAYVGATFWDSMEHIRDLNAFIRDLGSEWLFVSMPIFESESNALSSKHYRPNEHWWYFTDEGLQQFLGQHGYSLVSRDDFESSQCGRESIGTFAFTKI